MNHYEVLNINQKATNEEIKKAYRYLAMQWHPDKFDNDKKKQEANEKFIEISEAYQALIDEEKRKKYDEALIKSNKKESLNTPPTKNQNYQDDLSNRIRIFTKMLIELNALYVNRTDLGKKLVHAVYNKEWQEVVILILQGASLNEQSANGFGALHYLTSYNELDRVKCYLGFGQLGINVNVNLKSKDGKTPIYYAVKKNNYKLCQLLVQSGAELHHQLTDSGNTVLHTAIAEDCDDQIIKFLIINRTKTGFITNRISTLDIQNNDGDTPLHLAAKKGKIGIAELLIKNNANREITNNQGKDYFTVYLDNRKESNNEDTNKLIYTQPTESSCLMM